MQLLFGCTGPMPDALQVCHQIMGASVESHSHIQPAVSTAGSMALGHTSRRYRHWHGADPDLHLFLEGEIREADEVLLPHRGNAPSELAAVADLYRRHGSDVWQRLDGSFCLIIMDGPLIQIGVDTVGARSVYWWVHNGMLAFHTHLIDLATVYPGHLSEDYGAIGTFLACGAYPPGRTPYHEIHQLGSGCYLTFVEGQAQVAEHFRMVCPNTDRTTSQAALVGELGDRLAESIGNCWRAAQQPAILVSGGGDSRYIAAEVARQVADRSQVRTISYGESCAQAGSDGHVAAQVAAALGLSHEWIEISNCHQSLLFDETIYLTSGADDSAVLYADHCLLYRDLAENRGCAAVLRGDQCFSRGPQLRTFHSVLADNEIYALASETPGYRPYIAEEILQTMVEQQAHYLSELIDTLQSPTPAGCRDEMYYAFRIRQVLAPASRMMHAYLDVYQPFLSRRLLDWYRTVPSRFRHDKMLFRRALRHNFPALQHIPFATARNQGNWEKRFQTDRNLLGFYHDWFAAPGWLDTVGDKRRLLATFDTLMQHPQATPAAPARARELRSWLKKTARKTLPGQLYRELYHENRAVSRTPHYLKFGRMAVLHGLLGRIEQRRSRAHPALQNQLGVPSPMGAKHA